MYTLNEIVHGRLREGKKTYGVRGRMWRVIKRMYEASRSAVLLDGEKSASFSVEQGVALGCSLSPMISIS